MYDYSSFKTAVCKSISKDFSQLMDLILAANDLIWIFLTKDAKWKLIQRFFLRWIYTFFPLNEGICDYIVDTWLNVPVCPLFKLTQRLWLFLYMFNMFSPTSLIHQGKKNDKQRLFNTLIVSLTMVISFSKQQMVASPFLCNYLMFCRLTGPRLKSLLIWSVISVVIVY